jgi:hypothetical protein
MSEQNGLAYDENGIAHDKQLFDRTTQLEQRVQTLEEELAYFNLVFPSYADAINILKARIEILESKL